MTIATAVERPRPLAERTHLRILLVINGLDFGGTESAVAQLALCLAERGHEVRVLSVKQPGRTARQLREAGVDVGTLDMEEVAGIFGMAHAAWRMRRLLRGQRVDVVHAFLPRANIISRVANRLSSTPAPHVSSERSTDFQRSPRVARLNRWTARWTDLVLAVSPMVRDVLVARDGLGADKIHVLENGIDLDVVDAVPATDLFQTVPGLVPGRVVFCSVGRFVREKGLVYLVRAFGRMQSRDGAQLLLVGEGPLEGAIREEVRRLGLDTRVHFTGFRPDVLSVLKGTDVYVLSSVEEGSPMVVLEAMACGLPVIATDVSGVRSLAGSDEATPAAMVVAPAEDWSAPVLARPKGPTGVDQEEEAVRSMAEAMDRLVVSTPLRLALGATARRRVEEHFTLERIVSRLEEHYTRLRGA